MNITFINKNTYVIVEEFPDNFILVTHLSPCLHCPRNMVSECAKFNGFATHAYEIDMGHRMACEHHHYQQTCMCYERGIFSYKLNQFLSLTQADVSGLLMAMVSECT